MEESERGADSEGNKKNRNNPSSYRPISLLDTAGKMYEHLIVARWQQWSADAGIGLSYRQSDFRSGRSTVDAL